MAPNRRQAITWTNAGPVHWRIYAALGGDELILGVYVRTISIHITVPGADSKSQVMNTYMNNHQLLFMNNWSS